MGPIAIFEDKVEETTTSGVQIKKISGWVGPEEGYEVPQKDADGNKTGVSTVEYPHYAKYTVRIMDNRLSYWRIKIVDSGLISVYEMTDDGGLPAMELEGNGAAGILRVAQIINAVMSLAVSYCDEPLEKQKPRA